MWRTAAWRLSASRTSIVSSPGHREDVLAALGREALDEQGGGRSGGVGSCPAVYGRALPGDVPAPYSSIPDATTGTLLRLAAFTTDPSGRQPGGRLDRRCAAAPTPRCSAIAAEVGYSETAFLAPDGARRGRARSGSATSARWPRCRSAATRRSRAASRWPSAGWPRRPRPTASRARIVSTTNGGPVAIAIEPGGRRTDPGDPDDGRRPGCASPSHGCWPARSSCSAGGRRARSRAAAGGRVRRREPPHPRRRAGSTGWNASTTRSRRSRRSCCEHDLTTLQLVWRETPARFRARDPFPVGGVVEDPATGAAAAALGRLPARARGEIRAPASFEIVQGVEMGRPSRMTVSIVPGEDGVRVSGNAVAI